jgi:CRISPR-associated protein Csm1
MPVDDKTLNAALAGLLHDTSRFGGDFMEQCVPSSWQNHVKAAVPDAVKIASGLAAGEPKTPDTMTQPGQLLSIFCSLELDSLRTTKDLYWPLAPMGLDARRLGSDGAPPAFLDSPLPEEAVHKQYADLGREFLEAARSLRQIHEETGDLETYLESLLLLMQRFAWCVPSLYKDTQPEVSLYDHSRMTAALAAIIADRKPGEVEDLRRAASEHQQPIALLVGGDLSGVQDFIYTTNPRRATSALRGRSFYLQLLGEATARFILDQLGLPITNLIYSGGGNFYLLARPSDTEQLIELQRYISQALLYHHRGDLYLAINCLPLTRNDFFLGKISNRWDELGKALQTSKQRRFAELQGELADLFEPQGHGGNDEKQCDVCGLEHTDVQEDRKTASEEERGVRKCKPCRHYEDLGDELRSADYLVLQKIEPSASLPLEQNSAPGTWEESLACFGFRARPMKAIDLQINGSGTRRWILALKDNALAGLQEIKDVQTVTGRRFVVNITPKITQADVQRWDATQDERLRVGNVKPFDMLEGQAQGVERLGVLRMDVDNLGRLFSEGFKDHATLSRIASLSLAISLFFEGWVEMLAEKQSEVDKLDRLYSVYSGGDDLFFVGSWDAVIELARRIRAALSAYAADHPAIHLSAGLVLIGGKYPLYQAAQDAHRAEERAKSHQWYSGDEPRLKDSICFLGQVLPWEQFGLQECEHQGMDSAHALFHWLVAGEKSSVNPVVRRLIRLHERYQLAVEKRRREGADRSRSGRPQVLWGPWNWLGYYTLGRLYARSKDTRALQIRDELHKEDHFRSIEWIGLAARWAELWMR